MAELLLNDPIALRQLILYECTGKTPIFLAFQKFCTRLGHDFMKYLEFEFWFMRFEQKLFDLEYDRSHDPPPRNLMSLPDEVLNQVVDLVKVEDRLSLQKVCKPIRQTLLNRDPGFKILTLEVDQKNVNIDYGCKYTSYIQYYHPDYMIFYGEATESTDRRDNEIYLSDYGRPRKYVKHEHFLEMATSDLALSFKNPRLELEKMYIEQRNSKFSELLSTKLNGHKIHVKFVKILINCSPNDIKMMEILDPIHLDEVILNIKPYMNEDEMYEFHLWEKKKNHLDELLQMKILKEVGMVRLMIKDCHSHWMNCILNKITHLPRVTVDYPIIMWFLDIADRLNKVILNSTVLEILKVKCEPTWDIVVLRQRLLPTAIQDPDNDQISKFSIPDTDRKLEMRVEEDFICIKRIE